jgi:phosphate transport system permease protein
MESAKLDSNIKPEQLILSEKLVDAGIMAQRFNWGFITAPDASDQRPEAAGLGVAIIGSFYMMLIVLVLSLPIGVAASIYLEEFAPKNRWTDLIEVNIANLAAVPSIVFGILGLAVFINFAGLPQSAPIVGGLVLTLMTLPRIIIPARAALKSVPPSIRDAALGVGASKLQSVFHHVLPLAAPGILTGMIIGLAQALGETAPLLLIGMVAFVRDYPSAPMQGFFDPASALPVQVFNWTVRGDPGFVERASGAIIVLLVFLLIMNAVAIILRRRFERRW